MSDKILRFPSKLQVKECLNEMLDRADHLEGVIVVALNKDGTQFLSTSAMSHESKCFLKCFFDAYVAQWFSEMQEK